MDRRDRRDQAGNGKPGEDPALPRVESLGLRVPRRLRHHFPTTPENFEIELHTGMELALKPGQVVFELGTYCGTLSALAARRVGGAAGGKVVVFEASAAALRRAAALARFNRLGNLQFVRAFVSEKTGGRQTFFAIDGGAGAAVQSADPAIGRSFSESSAIEVPTLALDDWVDRHGLRPGLIKIDIEGAEYRALAGTRRLLADAGPDLVLEIHGDRLAGVGGSLAETYHLLAGLGYRFLDLHTAQVVTAEELLSRYPIYGHVFCSRALADPATRADLERRAAEGIRLHRSYEQLKEALARARARVDRREFFEAGRLLRSLLEVWPDHPQGHYLLAFTLQALGESPEQALDHYRRALELGFSGYWVRSHRAQLLRSLGRLPAALPDLTLLFANRLRRLWRRRQEGKRS